MICSSDDYPKFDNLINEVSSIIKVLSKIIASSKSNLQITLSPNFQIISYSFPPDTPAIIFYYTPGNKNNNRYNSSAEKFA